MIVQVYARLDAALVKELKRKALELDMSSGLLVLPRIRVVLKRTLGALGVFDAICKLVGFGIMAYAVWLGWRMLG